jgi:hypothetical protein
LTHPKATLESRDLTGYRGRDYEAIGWAHIRARTKRRRLCSCLAN